MFVCVGELEAASRHTSFLDVARQQATVNIVHGGCSHRKMLPPRFVCHRLLVGDRQRHRCRKTRLNGMPSVSLVKKNLQASLRAFPFLSRIVVIGMNRRNSFSYSVQFFNKDDRRLVDDATWIRKRFVPPFALLYSILLIHLSCVLVSIVCRALRQLRK